MARILEFPSHFATADETGIKGPGWPAHEWGIARDQATANEDRGGALLILDEAQGTPGWSETVKRLWDMEVDYVLKKGRTAQGAKSPKATPSVRDRGEERTPP